MEDERLYYGEWLKITSDPGREETNEIHLSIHHDNVLSYVFEQTDNSDDGVREYIKYSYVLWDTLCRPETVVLHDTTLISLAEEAKGNGINVYIHTSKPFTGIEPFADIQLDCDTWSVFSSIVEYLSE